MIHLPFYGVAAFVLAFLGYATLLFLLAGVVLIVEKDEWATRQVIQAFCLCIVSELIREVLGIVDFINSIPFIGTVWSTALSVIYALIGLVVFIFCLIGIINNIKGKDANVPLAGKFADWAFGIVVQRVMPQTNQTQQ